MALPCISVDATTSTESSDSNQQTSEQTRKSKTLLPSLHDISVSCYLTLRSRWAFLFDKVMLLCRKANRLGFDVRHSPKHVFSVSTLRVEPVYSHPSARGGKVRYTSSVASDLHVISDLN